MHTYITVHYPWCTCTGTEHCPCYEYAKCSCGWESPWRRDTEDAARSDWEDHVIASNTKEA